MQQLLREAMAVERQASATTIDVLRAQAARAPAVPIRRERVAQYWTPVPPRDCGSKPSCFHLVRFAMPSCKKHC